jgi:CHAT domain-containing protein
MNEEQIALYRDLIKKLLICPSGEESGILQLHRELWDEELVLTLQLVAEELQGSRYEDKIGVLLHLAEQLAEMLGMEDGKRYYLSFLVQVLQKVSDSAGDTQVIYPFLEKNVDKLNDDFCQTLRNWGTKILQIADPEQARSHGIVLLSFGNLIQQFPYGDRASKLEIAITAYELALMVFTHEYNAGLWASIQSSLGILYKDRINGSQEENLERSIQHYQAALTVENCENSSEDWAKTQYSLGNTYLRRVQLYEPDNLELASDNLELAIKSYQLVLEISTLETTSPKLWAMSNTNIGIAYFRRIKGDRSENLEKAIGFSQAALTVHTFVAYPTDWAIAQKNLGGIYLERIQGNRAENLEKAIEFFQGASRVYTRETFPEDWEMVQNNLFVAYGERIKEDRADNKERSIELYIGFGEATLGAGFFEVLTEEWAEHHCQLANGYIQRINGLRADNLERSIESYKAALTFYTREAFPEDWARITNSLALTYVKRIKGERADNIETAIGLYQGALTVRTREASAEFWAETQNNLANAYMERIREDEAENLERAIDLYEANLSVFTPTAFLTDWAMTQTNLGLAYSGRIKGERVDNLEKSIELSQSALTVYTLEAFPEEWANTKHRLAVAYNNRIKGNRIDNQEKAIELYQEALTVFTIKAFPEQWADTQCDLARVYNLRIKGDNSDNIEIAIDCCEKALTVFTNVTFPEKWARTQNNLASAYSDRIKGKKTDNLELAIGLYQEALTVYTKNSYPRDWAMITHNLANAYRDRIEGNRVDNLEEAIKLYRECLSIRTFEAFPEKWAMTQNNLAIAYERSSRIRRQGRDKNIELASLCIELAIQHYKYSLVVYTSTKFPQEWAQSKSNLANAYSKRIIGSRSDNLKWAIELYQEALTIYTFDAFPFSNTHTLENLGRAYLYKLNHLNQETPVDNDQKNSTIAIAYTTFRDAIARANNLRHLTSNKETKEKHDLQWDSLYQGMVQICLERHSDQEALEYAEANKARNLAELIAQRQEIPQTLEPITFRQITQLLTTSDTALMEWYITDTEIITFVLTYSDVLTVHRSRKWNELTDLVAEYQNDYRSNKDDWQTKLPSYLQRLADLLYITTLLPQNCQRLILIPHWFLHLFPLHALPIGGGEFLLDRFPQGIQYAPSCQLLQQIKIQPNFTQLLALQNPTADLIYTDLEVTSIAPTFPTSQVLSGSAASKTNLLEQYLDQLEKAHCAHFSCHGYFNPADPLRSCLILSGGIIANSPEETTRYISWRGKKTADLEKCLTLAEIFSLQLKQCRLVVLSACETALVDINNRSDYIGLSTGFIHAGAMGTLASLWAVNDLSTALMMIKFYELFQPQNNPSISPSQALHKTQGWFRSATTADLQTWVENSRSFDAGQKEDITEYLGGYKATERPYSDVYHWAAFCAIGL